MTAERPTTERLREALTPEERAMLAALTDYWRERYGPADAAADPTNPLNIEGARTLTRLYREALAAAPVDRDGLTPLQREVAEAPACVRCERAITTLGDLYRCAQCNGAFHLTCIHEHFGWTVNGAPAAERHAATPDRDGLDVDALENIIREQSYRKDRPGEWAAAVAREYAAIKEKP